MDVLSSSAGGKKKYTKIVCFCQGVFTSKNHSYLQNGVLRTTESDQLAFTTQPKESHLMRAYVIPLVDEFVV
jgi:hypothetical protein